MYRMNIEICHLKANNNLIIENYDGLKIKTLITSMNIKDIMI